MAFPRYYLFEADEQTLSEFHRAMGHPVRKRIIRDLKKTKMTVSDMMNRYGYSRETMSQHMDILRRADLVKYREVYPYTFYWRNEKQIAKMRALFEASLADL